MVILVDDEDRENEGDLVVAASTVTAEHINFMAREGRGLICLALASEQADRLGLAPMTRNNTAPLGTAFTNSIDHRERGGIGATARAATIRAAIEPAVRPEDFVTPGFVFPLRARNGGVLMRSGQTEGSVDLARLAGLVPAGVICEVMGPDGAMSRLPHLLEFGERHGIKVISVADLIRYRLRHERLMRLVSTAHLPTEWGDFEVRCFENTVSGQIHLTLSIGEPDPEAATLVRVHRADTIADVFGLDFLPLRSRLAWSLKRMADEGAGVLLYLRPEGPDELLDMKVRLYGARARGERTEKPSEMTMGFHDFGIGAQILRELGLRKIRVLTGQPRVFKGLSGYDIEIVDWVPIGEPA
jgi:3,4-dihydroxy 2-butanone 4-phosphate synthase/GTP cyclohydrolase II